MVHSNSVAHVYELGWDNHESVAVRGFRRICTFARRLRRGWRRRIVLGRRRYSKRPGWKSGLFEFAESWHVLVAGFFRESGTNFETHRPNAKANRPDAGASTFANQSTYEPAYKSTNESADKSAYESADAAARIADNSFGANLRLLPVDWDIDEHIASGKRCRTLRLGLGVLQ